jgi:hypothetical protein
LCGQNYSRQQDAGRHPKRDPESAGHRYIMSRPARIRLSSFKKRGAASPGCRVEILFDISSLRDTLESRMPLRPAT